VIVLAAVLLAGNAGSGRQAIQPLTWPEVPAPVAPVLAEYGFDAGTAGARLADIRRRNLDRVREGDRDYLVQYALEATTFTTLLPVDPSASARSLVSRLTDADRAALERGGPISEHSIPVSARARLDAFAAAATDPSKTPSLGGVKSVLAGIAASTRPELQQQLYVDYLRAMRFLYDKEFAAERASPGSADGSRLYQTRGLSTDASVEAGYAVYLALSTLRSLEPQRTVRRVLIVGPGLDSAERAGFVTGAPAQSYQPFAVMDALLALKLATADSLTVLGADINPRVVEWLRDVIGARLRLRLQTSVTEVGGVRFADEFRRYFTGLGAAIGESGPPETPVRGRLAKTLDVASAVTHGLGAAALDVVVDRLADRFDIVVVTNVFPYLNDEELTLAVVNIGAMLAPGGVLIHNEPRPVIGRAAAAIGLSPIHTQSTVIASVEGSPAPISDAVWMHRAR
jgi:Nodulation protein S (NodS)